MKHSRLNKTKHTQTSAPKTNLATTTACIKNTHRRESVLPNAKDEPKMKKAQCSLRRQCDCLQCVRHGERGVAVAAPINPTNKIKIKIKQQLMKHSRLNETKHTNFGTKKPISQPQQPASKTLTSETQFFQMRKMNQR